MREFENNYDYDLTKSKIKVIDQFKQYILKPLIIGLFTFSVFFTTILITKIFTYLLNEHTLFNLNIYDVLFALIGFGIGFIIELALNVRNIFSK